MRIEMTHRAAECKRREPSLSKRITRQTVTSLIQFGAIMMTSLILTKSFRFQEHDGLISLGTSAFAFYVMIVLVFKIAHLVIEEVLDS